MLINHNPGYKFMQVLKEWAREASSLPLYKYTNQSQLKV